MPPKPQNKAPVFDIERILDFLPHRYPFLLIDRVVELNKGKSLVGFKNVTFNEEFFQGHFPQKKVMPGVLIIESIAQAGVILIHHSIPDPESKLYFFSKIDDARFRKPVVPGDQLRLEVEIIKLKERTCHMKGRAVVDDEVVAEIGSVLAAIVNVEEKPGQE
jgi:beta-hydroxyacyl-ACP dehydratase FabZ